jgi:hypothetical protein
MSTIGKLFGSSPFSQIQLHMSQVAKCVSKLKEALDAMQQGRFDELEDMYQQVSSLEHQADQIKDDIRNRLIRRLLMTVDRSEILEIVALQDSLADTAEDLCVVMTMKKLPIFDDFRDDLKKFIELNLESFAVVEQMIAQIDELIDAGFGGPGGERIRAMAHDVAYAEHQADLVQAQLLKKLYAHDQQFSIGEFHLWMRLTSLLSRISNNSENLANRILKTLSIK